MAGSFSNYAENELLDHLLGTGAAFAQPTPYIALYTVVPTDAGGGTEVSGGGYARETAAFSAASGGATSNSGAISFTTATADWGTIVAFGIFDAASGGNLLAWGDLTENKTVNNGDTISFAIGDLDVTLD